MGEYNPNDPNSFSRSDQLLVTHLHLNLTVNFETKKLLGTVTHTVKRQTQGVDILILDTRDLNIIKVTDVIKDKLLEFEVVKNAETPTFLGQKLVIKLLDTTSETYEISVEYETMPNCTALQWLDPEQTAGKKHSYLFSQCEAIHCRSMIPCQDTPAVKATYSAEISAPKPLTVLMSAVKSGETSQNSDDNIRTHTFHQKVPIPSYLIAIVVGALENRKISERIDVWSEVEMVDKAAYEFAKAEIMLTTAEKLVGPYVWGRYDILVLPPSFPFGGMENPCLTFVTPTLLAGDRSLADVIAHEISHSWTGNLVTNINFEHFWLNEGFTVYLERLIDGEMFGEEHRQLKSILGGRDLTEEILKQGISAPFTKLVVDLRDKDPDDSFSTVPYEKGFAFLYYLETKVGGRENFTKFLKSYIESHKYQSIDTKTWKNFLLNYFAGNKELETVDFDAWLDNPGFPPEKNSYDQTLENECVALRTKWVEAKEPADFDKFSIDDIKKLHSVQVQEFLKLLRDGNLPITTLEVMKKIYQFNSTENCEIKCQWILLGLQNRWKEVVALALQFVVEQGRMKFLRPIYRALYNWEEVRQAAIDTFLKHRDQMMYVAVHAVEKELHL